MSKGIEYWRKKQVRIVDKRQEAIVAQFTREMNAALKKAAYQTTDRWEMTGQYIEPGLNNIQQIGDRFYRAVITGGYHAAKDTLKLQNDGKQKPTKQLAADIPKGKLPNSLKDLEAFFRNSKDWKKVGKRKQALFDKLRKAYLGKLKRKFRELIIAINNGDMSVDEAKAKMRSSWKASAPRVETIFRTETTNYFARSQTSFFKDTNILGFLFDSVRDVSRSKICESRHGLVYRPDTQLLRENTPACHYNCRSHLIPLANTPENRKLLEDPSRDPTVRKVVPLPPGWAK